VLSDAKKHIIIGDIHGCLNSLNALLAKLESHLDRTFVFLGDYIDRGPDSRGVIDRLIEFSGQAQCVFLRGNHEQMALDAFLDDDKASWRQWLDNGGMSTMDSYAKAGTSLAEADGHLDFMLATDFFYETADFICVHGGINPFMSVAENVEQVDPFEFLWERRHIQTVIPDWEKTVIFGHTPMVSVKMESNLIGLDTGCVFQDRGFGHLSALLMPEREIIDVICNDKHPS
jgi:serine/threonine protein phosphatase 1